MAAPGRLVFGPPGINGDEEEEEDSPVVKLRHHTHLQGSR